jgi:hypothetical protein
MPAGPGPLPGNRPATRSAARAGSPRLGSAQDRGEDCALFPSLVRSGMPIPGCVVRRFLRRQSYAQSAWFVNRVQCQGRFGESRDRNRPVAMGDMPDVKSERSSQCQGIARTVMLMPGHAVRACVGIGVGQGS